MKPWTIHFPNPGPKHKSKKLLKIVYKGARLIQLLPVRRFLKVHYRNYSIHENI